MHAFTCINLAVSHDFTHYFINTLHFIIFARPIYCLHFRGTISELSFDITYHHYGLWRVICIVSRESQIACLPVSFHPSHQSKSEKETLQEQRLIANAVKSHYKIQFSLVQLSS